jgi:CDP-diacylglycerol--serine O-phosphatidyltransferase
VGAFIPQVLTGTRLIFGAAALIAALDGDLWQAATLVTLGAVTDGLDGPVARALGASSPFGALFDYFSDYLCYIVAPWALARALVERLAGVGPMVEVLLALPLLTGAIRYARNGVLVTGPTQEVRDLPGLGTVFFAFVGVTAVFAEADTWLPGVHLARLVVVLVTTFSIMMIVPVQYPKFSRLPGASPLVLVLLCCLPFVGTRAIAVATFVLGMLYALTAWLFARRN